MSVQIREEKRAWGLAALALLVALTFSKIEGPIFRALFLDVETVTISEQSGNVAPKVSAYRKIKKDYTGGFSVEVRDATTGTYVCKSPYPWRLNYKAAANQINPLEMSLRQWFGTAADYDACLKDSRYASGEFFTITCHWTHVFGWLRLERCVDSNVYERHVNDL